MNWVIIGSGNVLSPVRRQAITWTNADLLSITPLGTNFGEILINGQNVLLIKMHLKMSSAKRRPFCLRAQCVNRTAPSHKQHWGYWSYNTLRPRQNGRLFPDDIFKCIFLNANVWIVLEISLKFVSNVRIDNIPALVQIMAWRRPGDNPLSEPTMA